jgi:hypothetical protein
MFQRCLLLPSLLALMMEAANTSEMSVKFYQTIRRNDRENSHPHTRRRENLKSHKKFSFIWYCPIKFPSRVSNSRPCTRFDLTSTERFMEALRAFHELCLCWKIWRLGLPGLETLRHRLSAFRRSIWICPPPAARTLLAPLWEMRYRWSHCL